MKTDKYTYNYILDNVENKLIQTRIHPKKFGREHVISQHYDKASN